MFFDLTSYLLGKHSGGGDNPPILVDRTITENGTYNAVDDQADGYKSVTVEVDPTPPEPPTDGKTRLYISLAEGRLSPVLGLGVNGTVDVDWGDGTAHGTLTGSSTSTLVTIPHTYTRGGDYVITLTAAEGTTIAVVGESSNALLLTKDGTSGNQSNVYYSALKKAHPGDSVTSIGIGAFYNCYSLASVTIPDSITNIKAGAFRGCVSLASVTIPDSITSMENSAFRGCYSLASVTIPDSITSIENSMFRDCYSLASVTIPDSITSIGTFVFYACYGIGFIRFESTTPPIIGASNTFGVLPIDCIIYVPEGTLEDYTSATNYPDDSVYTYVEY